jgi:hypothetical protein
MTTSLTNRDLIAIASDLQTRPTQITSSISTVAIAAPGPVTGFLGRSTVGSSVWNPKHLFEDESLTLAPEAKFMNTYGSRPDAYPSSFQTTDKKGYYDPIRTSVIDGLRVLNSAPSLAARTPTARHQERQSNPRSMAAQATAPTARRS